MASPSFPGKSQPLHNFNLPADQLTWNKEGSSSSGHTKRRRTTVKSPPPKPNNNFSSSVAAASPLSHPTPPPRVTSPEVSSKHKDVINQAQQTATKSKVAKEIDTEKKKSKFIIKLSCKPTTTSITTTATTKNKPERENSQPKPATTTTKNKPEGENPQPKPHKIEMKDDHEDKNNGNDLDEDGKIWNLRPRKPLKKSKMVTRDDEKGKAPEKNKSQFPPAKSGKKEGNSGGGGGGDVKKPKKKPSFTISLSKREIEEDIYALTGRKPARRPKKWPKHIQKQLDAVFPGLRLMNR